jgi:hypothetical protein
MSAGLRNVGAARRDIANRRLGTKNKGLGYWAAFDAINGNHDSLPAKVQAKMPKKLQKRIAHWNTYKCGKESGHEHKCPGSNK